MVYLHIYALEKYECVADVKLVKALVSTQSYNGGNSYLKPKVHDIVHMRVVAFKLHTTWSSDVDQRRGVRRDVVLATRARIRS